MDVKVGAGVETRCSVGDSYADGQWHQVVHTLGAGGNALYLDGALAVSSPTTASTFTAQDRLLVGYAPAAAAPYLTGSLDDVIIYDGQLSAGSVAALYRRWQPATLAGGQWSFTVPAGLEGYYQIDMRATDSVGNRTESRGDWPQFRGPVDTKFPEFDLAVEYSGFGNAAQTTFSARHGRQPDDRRLRLRLPVGPEQLRYVTSPAQLEFAGPDESSPGSKPSCVQPGFRSSQVAARVRRLRPLWRPALPPSPRRTSARCANTLTPFGSRRTASSALC